MKYTAKEIIDMRTEAIQCNLTAPWLFWSGDLDRLQEILNGCGADWMPEWAVDALTWVFRKYEETVAIHDCRYELAGTEGTREEADNEFRENALKQWEKEYGSYRWINPAAWVGRRKIRLAYKALRAFGGKAWEEAKAKDERRNMKDEIAPDGGEKTCTGAVYVLLLLGILFTSGCTIPKEALLASASGKNLDMDGYMLMGAVETVSPDTASPQGKMILGRVSYHSRKVSIPADQKVPTTGRFKSTRTKSLFGTEEDIVEYDFTAGSDKEAEEIRNLLEEKRKSLSTETASGDTAG